MKKNDFTLWPIYEVSKTFERAVRALHKAKYVDWTEKFCHVGWDEISPSERRRALVRAQKEMARRLGQDRVRMTARAAYTEALVAVQAALEELAVYRERKGKQVRVPDKWVGVCVSPTRMHRRKELAKLKRKERRNELRKDKLRAFKESE